MTAKDVILYVLGDSGKYRCRDEEVVDVTGSPYMGCWFGYIGVADGKDISEANILTDLCHVG